MAESLNDQIHDALTEETVQALRVETATRQKVLQFLKLLEQDLVSALKDVDPAAPELLRRRQERLRSLLEDEIRPLIQSRFRQIATETEADAVRLALFVEQNTVQTINELLKVDLLTLDLVTEDVRALVRDTLLPSVATAQELTAPAATWWERQAVNLEHRLFDQINLGIVQRESLQELIDRLRGTPARNFTDGVMELSRRDAERLIRTHIASVVQQARVASYDANSDTIKAIMHSSVLDNRTSLICIARNGNTYSVPDHEPLGATKHPYAPIPLHWQCRSIYTPVLKSARELFGPALQDLSPADQAKLDGEPPKPMTFEAFLQRKGHAFQDKLLGPTRARMFREGKLSLKQLIDASTGKPLTLEELDA